MKANKDVFDNMRKNPKVRYDGERFSYKVTFILAYNLHVFDFVHSDNNILFSSYTTILVHDIWHCFWSIVETCPSGQKRAAFPDTQISRGHCCY